MALGSTSGQSHFGIYDLFGRLSRSNMPVLQEAFTIIDVCLHWAPSQKDLKRTATARTSEYLDVGKNHHANNKSPVMI